MCVRVFRGVGLCARLVHCGTSHLFQFNASINIFVTSTFTFCMILPSCTMQWELISCWVLYLPNFWFRFNRNIKHRELCQWCYFLRLNSAAVYGNSHLKNQDMKNKTKTEKTTNPHQSCLSVVNKDLHHQLHQLEAYRCMSYINITICTTH